MKIEEITLSKKVNLGNYENCEVQVKVSYSSEEEFAESDLDEIKKKMVTMKEQIKEV